MSESSINISEMSGVEETCFVCDHGMGINHLCINLEAFRNLAIVDQNTEDTEENQNNDFVFNNADAIEEMEAEELVVYNLEGEEEHEPADLSIISYMEESQGYLTNLQTPPNRPPRRSSTPDVTRARRALSFDEFIENLVDDSIEMPGLEQMPVLENLDSNDELDSLEEFMEF